MTMVMVLRSHSGPEGTVHILASAREIPGIVERLEAAMDGFELP